MVKKHFNRLNDLKKKNRDNTLNNNINDIFNITLYSKLYNILYKPNKNKNSISDIMIYLKNKDINKYYMMQLLDEYDKKRDEMLDILKSANIKVNIVDDIRDLKPISPTEVHFMFLLDLKTFDDIENIYLTMTSDANLPIFDLLASFFYEETNNNDVNNIVVDFLGKSKLLIEKTFINNIDSKECCICFEPISQETKGSVMCKCSSVCCYLCANKMKKCCICKTNFDFIENIYKPL